MNELKGRMYPLYKMVGKKTVKRRDKDGVVRERVQVERNHKCPCGSGKRYKRCCMSRGVYSRGIVVKVREGL